MTLGTDSALANLWLPSPNFEARRGGRAIDLLLLHYTATETAEQALDWLTREESGVSSHYLIDEDGRISQMVAESERAWHAGISSWDGDTDINSCSIGIEIQNHGHEMGYPDFPDAEMQAVEALCLDILARHRIPAFRVLAHSDVAPGRKQDPGEKFDWARLHNAGIGLWAEQGPIDRGQGLARGDKGREVEALQMRLRAFGYGLDVTGHYETETETIVRNFQRHFRPGQIDGIADKSTLEVLSRICGDKAKIESGI